MSKNFAEAVMDKWFDGYRRALESGLEGVDAVIATNIWMDKVIKGGN